MQPQTAFKLVHLANGTCSVHSLADDETFHPGIGPEREAEALYVQQLQLAKRVRLSVEDFVLWDVGLGAAANALAAIRGIETGLAPDRLPRRLRLLSFDRTVEAAAFALEHAAELSYPAGFETRLSELVTHGEVKFSFGCLEVNWTVALGDFPAELSSGRSIEENAAPHAILFDPHSPQKNPAMWTLPLFSSLFRQLDPHRPCALATFSRSTMARAAMLLGGWFVGVGHASGLKEETTIAANCIELLAEPLGSRWLERAQRSDCAEPMSEAVYRRARISAETLGRLRAHPQFA